jgi:RNA polymerase sigma factor for flagellar operon FliA
MEQTSEGSAGSQTLTPLTTEQRRLASENVDLVKKVAATSEGLLSEYPPEAVDDDLISCGYLGLIEAARAFDANQGVPFPVFAQPRIANAMLEEVRRSRW